VKHWLLMFNPETYEVVKERGVIGVLHMHRRRFGELADGDKFIAYVSRQQVLDGHGTIVGRPYEVIEPLWPGRELYPRNPPRSPCSPTAPGRMRHSRTRDNADRMAP
jgi:hypothetical protein